MISMSCFDGYDLCFHFLAAITTFKILTGELVTVKFVPNNLRRTQNLWYDRSRNETERNVCITKRTAGQF